MDRYEDVERCVDEMADYWMKRKWVFLEQANEEFIDFVDPAVFYQECLRPEDVMLINLCFTEWVLFERPVLGRRTPLSVYVEGVVASRGDSASDILRQVADTQFFSRFAILDKDRARGVAALRDLRTDRRYDVHDPGLCARDEWFDGSVALRIAAIDDVWQMVGRVRLYDHAAPELTAHDGPGEVHPEDRLRRSEMDEAGFYLRLIRDTLGVEGRYHATARAVPSVA